MTSVLEPGHLRHQVAHQPGLRPHRSPLQREQRARRALQPDAQRQREQRHRPTEHVRPPQQQRVGERYRRRVAGHPARFEQGQRSARPLHLQHDRLATRRSPPTAACASRTPDFSNVPVSVSRAGVGNTGPPTGAAAEPRGEAPAVRQQLLDSHRLASVEVRRRHHPVVALRHVLQQLRRHLHVRGRHAVPVQPRQPGDVSLPVHAELRHLRA